MREINLKVKPGEIFEAYIVTLFDDNDGVITESYYIEFLLREERDTAIQNAATCNGKVYKVIVHVEQEIKS